MGMMTMSINWEALRSLQKQYNNQSLKIIYTVDNTRQTNVVTINKIEKAIWELYNRGIKHIMIIDEHSNILFEYSAANKVDSSVHGTPGYMADKILHWNNLDIKAKEFYLRMLFNNL